MKFNEDTRVKIPVILHLVRLGYQYLSLKEEQWDKNTNIFPTHFHKAIARINPDVNQNEINRLLQDISLSLDHEDLGIAFYNMLINRSDIKLIDFENFNNNSFHVVTELTYQNEDEEFRPDITLLINGLPLVFIEVKKPNNQKGMQVEYNRINSRFQNKKFRRFVNITQFMIFSNNMEYDENALLPIDGAFYASSSYHKLSFNYFREEEVFNLTALLKPLKDEQELVILKDNNLEVIRSNPEFQLNKEPNRPTNRICTSLLSQKRLAFILQYAFAYVSERDGLQKHIMRYPQIFATKAIENHLNKDNKKGIIWHTQGSGKTALAYYNVRFLTDYFQQKQIIPKFYFIVDRIDLLEQAHREFSNRGLVVHIINSRNQFSQEIKNQKAIHNHSGQSEITVVNIQKFKDEPDVVSNNDYNLSIQRIYFLDEVHRSYKPTGSFLANLHDSDREAIHIGLTGTPLLGDNNSRRLFGNYIHKYYYNASISDGYTLRLIREEIATHYKRALQKAIDEIEVKQGELNHSLVYANPHFVEPMLDYIINDFETSRHAYNDTSIGGMVICDSAEQARQMFTLFNEKYARKSSQTPLKVANDSIYSILKAAEPTCHYETKKQHDRVNSAALILHDEGTKEERKAWVAEFKAGNIDFLFVYNMLLTGFDAKRLKKLYLGRIIRQHNLLQALTRVNRPYKEFRYGYVVDFADIRKEFDATNRAYFNELQEELGDEIEHYSHLFKSSEEIEAEIEHIKDVLFRFDCENAEVFSDQINLIDDKKTVQALKKALENARSLYNIIRLQQNYAFLTHLDFEKLNYLYRVTADRLTTLNYKDSIEQGNDDLNLINIALEDIIFKFIKVGEEELILADQFRETLRKTREALSNNFDQEDPKFITLKEELERLFKKKNIREITQEDMQKNIPVLTNIYQRVKELNRQNELLKQKYYGDRKYTRLHKRLLEKNETQASERNIYEALMGIKQETDDLVLRNRQILNNESYFKRMVMPNIIKHFVERQHIQLNTDASDYLNQLIVTEYLKEFNYGAYSW